MNSSNFMWAVRVGNEKLQDDFFNYFEIKYFNLTWDLVTETETSYEYMNIGKCTQENFP